MQQLLYTDTEKPLHYLFRYTSKNEWAWTAPMFVRRVVGWAVIMPLLVLLNLAVFSLRGRWLHVYFECGDGVFMEYAPLSTDYIKRRFPALFFHGELRDSGKRLVRAILSQDRE